VTFRSHLDGSAQVLTPESVVDIQARLGSDVTMVFDECPSWPATAEEVEAATSRTLRWARRGRDRFLALAAGKAPEVPRATPDQLQFGIIQGGTHKTLRDLSVAGTLAVGSTPMPSAAFGRRARRCHVRRRRPHGRPTPG
jgi:queuine tRNA-ribosyltransferase